MVNSADWCLTKGYLICFQQSGIKITQNKLVSQKPNAHCPRCVSPWVGGQAASCRLTFRVKRVAPAPQIQVVETACCGRYNSEHRSDHAFHLPSGCICVPLTSQIIPTWHTWAWCPLICTDTTLVSQRSQRIWLSRACGGGVPKCP